MKERRFIFWLIAPSLPLLTVEVGVRVFCAIQIGPRAFLYWFGQDRAIVTGKAHVARHYGAEVPFLRPSEIAGDTSPDIEWVEYDHERLEVNSVYDWGLAEDLVGRGEAQLPKVAQSPYPSKE
jgi:hypothetical protein